MATKGNIAQNNLFFIIKQLAIVKIFHKGKEYNRSKQEIADARFKFQVAHFLKPALVPWY